GQDEETTVVVDGVEMPGWEGNLEEMTDMIKTQLEQVAEQGKGQEVKRRKKTESERSQKIAQLRHNASQKKGAASPVAGSSKTSPSEVSTATTPSTSTRAVCPKRKPTTPAVKPTTSPAVPNRSAAAASTPVGTSREITSSMVCQTGAPCNGTPSSAVAASETGIATQPTQSLPSCQSSPLVAIAPEPSTTPSDAAIPINTSASAADSHVPSILSPAPDSPPPNSPHLSSPHLSCSVLPTPSPPHRMSPLATFRISSPVPDLPSPQSAPVSKATEVEQHSDGSRKRSRELSTSSKGKQGGVAAGSSGSGAKQRRKDSVPKLLSVNEEDNENAEEPAEPSGEEEETPQNNKDNTITIPEDAPAYVWKVAQMCELLCVGPEMNCLIEAWIQLEAAVGFGGNGILTSSSPPSQISKWIQHGRQPTFKAKILDIEMYGNKFTQWFKNCCPAWRTKREGTISMSREVGMDWSEMKLPRQNGVASIIAAMAFWKHALDAVPSNTPRQIQARRRLERQYQEALEEVTYCISQMSQMGAE
ncbi:hypothetical protein V5O48_017454, partial [Marasmius crinis-equi]